MNLTWQKFALSQHIFLRKILNVIEQNDGKASAIELVKKELHRKISDNVEIIKQINERKGS
jgi:hypothetical protein